MRTAGCILGPFQLLSSLDQRAGLSPTTPRFITSRTLIIMISSRFVAVGRLKCFFVFVFFYRVQKITAKRVGSNWCDDCSSPHFMLTFPCVSVCHRFWFPDPPADVSCRRPSGFGP